VREEKREARGNGHLQRGKKFKNGQGNQSSGKRRRRRRSSRQDPFLMSFEVVPFDLTHFSMIMRTSYLFSFFPVSIYSSIEKTKQQRDDSDSDS
jgi:hypothetical protein